MWVGGILVDQDTLDASSPRAGAHIEAIERRHRRIALRADEAHQVWRIEVYDPELDTVLSDFGPEAGPPIIRPDLSRWLGDDDGRPVRNLPPL
jgi:hypothetical protein